MKHFSSILALTLLPSLLTSCASSHSGRVYSRDEALVAQTVRLGTVESVQDVLIEGTKSPVGTLGGAALGGIGGHQFGGGTGKAAATIGGALLGGILGSAFEEGATRKDGLEITVLLDDGNRISVVQEADESFAPGDRVRVLSGRGSTRVTR